MSFTLGGKTAEELGIIMLRSSVRPVLPATSDRTLAIPGRPGLRDFGADLGARQFVLECGFIERDRFALEQRLITLAAHLVDSYGRPREMELTLATRPGQSFTVRYAGTLTPERIYGTGTLSLPLTAFDPFARGPEQIEEVTITDSPTVVNLLSKGNIRTEPVVILTNTGSTTLTEFRITNEYLLE